MKLVFPLALLITRAAAYAGQGLAALDLSSSAAAPAPAPASAAPAAPAATLATLQVKFEIKNYNYYDLTRKTCPKTKEKALNSRPKPAPSGPKKKKKLHVLPKSDEPDPINEVSNDFAKGVGKMKSDEGKPPWMKGKGEPKGASLLEASTNAGCVIQHKSLAAIHAQSDECKTVMEVFRSAVKEVIRDVIKCAFNTMGDPVAGGPAASQAASPSAAAPQAFLSVATAPLPPSGPPDVAIFVTFSPGHEIGSGRSVNIEITFTDTPGNGVDDVAATKQLLQPALDSGMLVREMKAALEIITAIRPKLGKMKMQAKAVEAWNVKKCEGHVKSLVEDFSHYYTREHVPEALYNECTNFVTRMSFSNDHVLDHVDTLLCRKTTAQFAEHWNYGKKAKPEDFELMCVRACEAKFGKGAPQCNVDSGDALAGKPLF